MFTKTAAALKRQARHADNLVLTSTRRSAVTRRWKPAVDSAKRHTESSEHFAEYTPWFIKHDRPDLIEKCGIPLDEYPKRYRTGPDELRLARRP
jgi:alpha-galactosidase/6-phospho-beta-glucosidase family protein